MSQSTIIAVRNELIIMVSSNKATNSYYLTSDAADQVETCHYRLQMLYHSVDTLISSITINLHMCTQGKYRYIGKALVNDCQFANISPVT